MILDLKIETRKRKKEKLTDWIWGWEKREERRDQLGWRNMIEEDEDEFIDENKEEEMRVV